MILGFCSLSVVVFSLVVVASLSSRCLFGHYGLGLISDVVCSVSSRMSSSRSFLGVVGCQPLALFSGVVLSTSSLMSSFRSLLVCHRFFSFLGLSSVSFFSCFSLFGVLLALATLVLVTATLSRWHVLSQPVGHK
ncbi:hypothetical protein V1525DRAFT_414364 [Lipomyces kononenkoae]|uniref:Uncharacterized protein n=1 Tax=Lipomyces kononenkoae TaxID=34357 RepID=A0ACC3SRP1_LIPKO